MGQIKSLGKILKKLNYVIPKDKKFLGYLMVILIIIGSILETIGVSAILPFIEAVLSPAQLLEKEYVQFIVDRLNIIEEKDIIVFIGICIIIVYFVKNAYLYSLLVVQSVYRGKVQKELSTKVLSAYMKRDYEYYVSVNTAEIIRGIGSDIIGVYNLLDNLFRFLGEAFTAFMISILIMYTDFFMALCMIVIAGICFLVLTSGLKGKIQNVGEQKRISEGERGKKAYQAIMGFKEIKVTRSEKYFVKEYEEAYERQRISEIKNDYIENIPEKLIEFVCIATLIGVICVRICLGIDMSSFIPKLAVFALAAFRLLPSVSRMTRYMNGIVYNNVFLTGAYDNLSAIDKKAFECAYLEKKAKDNIRFRDSIRFEEVYWNYRNSTKTILSGLSLEIKCGEAVGIIGASGAGKSTLMDILLGLLKPERGRILVDNRNIFEVPDEWSSMVAYVPQSVFLLDDTIRKNVAFGFNSHDIDEKRIWEVLREAQLDEFVRSLPEGLDAQVGERGIKFSGGQRQRVAIARALYRNPDIIVLDEATSALDNETEKAVMEAIELLHGQKTLIIVAHRLSTIENCDKVYEVVDGKALLQ